MLHTLTHVHVIRGVRVGNTNQAEKINWEFLRRPRFVGAKSEIPREKDSKGSGEWVPY